MYSFDSRIRYSEVGSDSKLTLLALLDYFQDCSTFQSEDLGMGVEWLKEHELVWVLNYWQIDIARRALLGEHIRIATHPYEFKKFMGSRNFIMTDEKGERVAVANSLWSLLNTRTGGFADPPEEMLKKYAIEPKEEMDYCPRKIALAGENTSREPVIVKKHHLDTNNHVNNGQYVAIAFDYMEPEMEISRLRATYHKSARLGDTLYPVVYAPKKGKRMTVALNDEGGQPYSVVEFS